MRKSIVVWAICEGREAWGNYEAFSDYPGDGAVSVVREQLVVTRGTDERTAERCFEHGDSILANDDPADGARAELVLPAAVNVFANQHLR